MPGPWSVMVRRRLASLTSMELFSGLNFFRPTQTYYRIRVKGFKNEWEVFSMHDGSGRVDEKGMLHYPIIGIPPGEYEIEVQTSMSPDEWTVDPFVWKLNVDEPWWRMTIAIISSRIFMAYSFSVSTE